MASSCRFVVANNYFSLNELLAFKSSEPWLKDIQDFLREWLNEKPHILALTSGSTGEPKSILLSKKAMKASAQLTNNFFSLNKNSKALLCLSSRYIAGKMMLVRALEGNYTLFMEEPSSSILNVYTDLIDFAALVPLQVEESFDKLKQIASVLVGGASLKTELEKKLQACSSRVFQSFGMTETVSHIALREVNGSNKTRSYHCLPNIEVEKDERNCLRIIAPMLLEEKLQTNDVVELVSPSEFVWKGRVDFVINSGGIKLFPEQIEAKLSDSIDLPFFISSLADDRLGERVILVCESVKHNNALKLSIENVFKTLSPYERPKATYFLDSFEYNNAKLLRSKTIEKLKKHLNK
jgi:o-succinylbenzoate---CoA ligase